jgi:hypothetical protein
MTFHCAPFFLTGLCRCRLELLLEGRSWRERTSEQVIAASAAVLSQLLKLSDPPYIARVAQLRRESAGRTWCRDLWD